MGSLGNLALMGGFAFSIFGTLAALVSAIRVSETLRVAAKRAFYATCVCVLIAVICLAGLLVTDQYRYTYVYSYSNLHLPLKFKLTAVWAGHQGSLLWWSLILSAWTSVFLFATRKLSRLLLSWSYVFIGLALIFFLSINNFNANPFEVWSQVVPEVGLQPLFPADGRGLNPQLQHWAMIIHPPLLYAGYIGFLFPFAIALAALIVRLEGREWIRITRLWTLTTWLILSVGIVLGGAWAYMELGWGGYWAWDPVENASFMPWLLGTAFLHSVMGQETRGMFKLWNVVLIVGTYLMCIFGTFITRSGLISSVHAFAESEIWIYFLVYLLVNLFLGALVTVWRLDQLRDDNNLNNVTSREGSLLFNNILFFSICGTMLAATMYPILTEWLFGKKIELRHGFYNIVELPIFMLLLVLMAFGPILLWKKSADRQILKKIRWGLVAGVIAFLAGIPILSQSRFAYFSFPVLSFLITVLIQDFATAIWQRSKRAKENLLSAFLSLVRMNQRRYGGYVVHFGVFLIALGITGTAFNQETKQDVALGESAIVGPFAFQVADVKQEETNNYSALLATINLLKDGKKISELHPEQRFYKASRSQASEVAIETHFNRDFYVVLAGLSDQHTAEHPTVVLHIYVNPLVIWVWIGTVIFVCGTLLSMFGHRLPERVRQEHSLMEGEPA
ncbi:MAG: heme lyase CcmF/NrfE family subunit [Acidobacteria bacterium]|nr:heme lyase CcmF/NrfE family subunit [Acidobacteriota bacterium]MCB9399366.1 heme lyase CcmF/NrfE family subunit [Acidobacteriota bacterium]